MEVINPNRGTFPIRVFPQVLKEIINEVSRVVGVPADYVGGSILFALSVAIGNSIKVSPRQGQEFICSLFMALVGRPGIGKTPVLNWVLGPLNKRDSEAYDRYVSEVSHWEQNDRSGTKPVFRQHLISDFTTEAMIKGLVNNPKGLGVYSDELASWYGGFNAYRKGNDEAAWLSLFNGQPIRKNRATDDPVLIKTPFASVIGGIQPGVLSDLVKGKVKNGFIDRILFCFPESTKTARYSEEEINKVVTDNWADLIDHITNVYKHTAHPIVLPFSPGAKKRWIEFYNENADEMNRVSDWEAGVLAKLGLYVPRLALILEVASTAMEGGLDSISPESLEGAIELSAYFKKTTARVREQAHFSDPVSDLGMKKQIAYSALPGQFRTKEGVEVAKRNDVPERTFKRWLNDKTFFEKIEKGLYRKIIE